MNNQLLMDNYLLIIKSTIEVYVHGTLESSNKDIKELLKLGLDKTLTHQANTYDIMTKNGWYTTNNVKSSAINQVLKSTTSN